MSVRHHATSATSSLAVRGYFRYSLSWVERLAFYSVRSYLHWESWKWFSPASRLGRHSRVVVEVRRPVLKETNNVKASTLADRSTWTNFSSVNSRECASRGLLCCSEGKKLKRSGSRSVSDSINWWTDASSSVSPLHSSPRYKRYKRHSGSRTLPVNLFNCLVFPLYLKNEGLTKKAWNQWLDKLCQILILRYG